MKRDITLVVAQSPRYYPHVARHLKSLKTIFSEVRLLYWEKDAEEPLYAFPGVAAERVLLPFGAGGTAFFAKLMWGFLRALIRSRPGAIEAIDPYALVPARCYALLRGAAPGHGRHGERGGRIAVRIAYFSMEYFSELPSLRAKPIKRRLWKSLERWGAEGSAAVATVCDSIAVHLCRDFRKDRVATVRNVPERSEAVDTGTLHARCGLTPGIPVAIYQGMLQEGRGLEACMDAVAAVPSVHLALAGSGPLREPLRARAEAAGCADRVHFLGEVDFRELSALTPGAFAGLAPFQALSTSYLYSLPGKMFEYIQAGVPVITTSLPEILKVVEGYGVGICIPEFGAQGLTAALRRLLDEPALLAEMRDNLPRAKAELCWETEQESYLSLYR